MTRESAGVPHPRSSSGTSEGPLPPAATGHTVSRSWVADWVELGRRFADMEAAADRTLTDDVVLRALTMVRSTRARLDDLERRLIVTARDRQVTWRRIADSLGVCTPQAAQQRFLRVSRPDTYPGPSTSDRSPTVQDDRSTTTNGGQRD